MLGPRSSVLLELNKMLRNSVGRPSTRWSDGRGNALNADGTELVCLSNVGGGLGPAVDVLRLI